MDGNERRIVGITMLGHALVHTYELSVPILIPVWIDTFGVTSSTIGLVVGAGYALFGFGSVPAGLLSDIYRSKPLVVACFAGMSVAFLAVSVAPSLAVLALALLGWGLAASIYHPVGLSLISRGVDRRGTALGYHGIAGNVGVALGPLVTLLVLAVFDWRVASAALALPGLVAVALVLWIDLDEGAIAGGARTARADGGADVGDPESLSLATLATLTRRTFSGLFVVVFVVVIFEGLFYRGALTFLPDMLGGVSTFDPISLFGRTLEPARYVFVGLLIVGIGGQYAGGWLSDRIEPALGVALAFAALAGIALLFIPLATAGVVPLLVVSALLGFVLFGEQPILQAAIAEHSTTETRGASYGFMYAGVFGVGAAGAAITGYLLTYFDATALFWFLALIAGLATATSLYLYRRG
jgi:MFS family permease